MRGPDALRLNRHDPAGDHDGKGAVAADEEAGQDYSGAARRGSENPGQLHPRGGAGDPRHECHRCQQQRDSGRLDGDEVAVGQDAGHQAQRAPEIRPIVILGDAQQETREGELVVDPQRQRQRGGDRDHHDDGRGRPSASRPRGLGIAQRPARDLAFYRFAHNRALSDTGRGDLRPAVRQVRIRHPRPSGGARNCSASSTVNASTLWRGAQDLPANSQAPANFSGHRGRCGCTGRSQHPAGCSRGRRGTASPAPPSRMVRRTFRCVSRLCQTRTVTCGRIIIGRRAGT